MIQKSWRLIKLDFGIHFERDLIVPALTSRVSRLILFRLLEMANPELVELLHAPQHRKGFSCTPLWDGNRYLYHSPNGFLRLSSDREHGFKVCSLIPEVCASLLDALKIAAEHGMKIPVFTTNAQISRLKIEAYSHQELKLEIGNSFKVSFLTPSQLPVKRSKKGKGIFRLFPVPDLWLHGLVGHWNKYAPEGMVIPETQFLEWAHDNVYEVDYGLRLVKLDLESGRATKGFVGWALYNVDQPSGKHFEALRRLLAYAQMVGLGKSRGMGLGVVSIS